MIFIYFEFDLDFQYDLRYWNGYILFADVSISIIFIYFFCFIIYFFVLYCAVY